MKSITTHNKRSLLLECLFGIILVGLASYLVNINEWFALLLIVIIPVIAHIFYRIDLLKEKKKI